MTAPESRDARPEWRLSAVDMDALADGLDEVCSSLRRSNDTDAMMGLDDLLGAMQILARTEPVAARPAAPREGEAALDAIREQRRAYEMFTPLTAEEVATAVTAIQVAIGDWGSDRMHAQWARTVLENTERNVRAALDAAGHGRPCMTERNLYWGDPAKALAGAPGDPAGGQAVFPGRDPGARSAPSGPVAGLAPRGPDVSLTYGELFAGIGGFGLAAEQSGGRVLWASELDPFAQRVYAARFPAVAQLGDVTAIQDAPLVDVITAGFPCQDVSVAGKRKGLVGERTGLFWEIIRLARRLRPRWLVLENVPGLLSSHRGRDFGTILTALDDCGYGVAWRVLDAQHFGVPQRRRRVFIVGHLGGPCPPEVLFEPESVSGDTPARGETGQDVAGSPGGGAGKRGWCDDTDRMTFVAHSLSSEGADASEDGTGRGTPIVAFDTTQITSKANRSSPQDGGTLNIVGVRPRRLTPRECERLQGFPDDWTLIDGASDSARYRALGNAVAVPCVAWILKRLAREARA